jgi:hypothetical protein
MSEAIDPSGAGEGVTELRQSLGGAVLTPTDEGFDAARRCFNTLVDRRPAVIVRCLDAGDVARAFDFAGYTRWRSPCAEVGTTPPDTASATAAW